MINAHSSDQISYHIPDWDYCQFTAIVNSQGILDIFCIDRDCHLIRYRENAQGFEKMLIGSFPAINQNQEFYLYQGKESLLLDFLKNDLSGLCRLHFDDNVEKIQEKTEVSLDRRITNTAPVRIVSSNRYETILFENMTAFSIKKIAVDWRNKSINSSMNSIDPIAKPPSQSPNQQLLTQLTDETKQLLDILANPELQDLQPKLTEINVTNTANQLHRMLLKKRNADHENNHDVLSEVEYQINNIIYFCEVHIGRSLNLKPIFQKLESIKNHISQFRKNISKHPYDTGKEQEAYLLQQALHQSDTSSELLKKTLQATHQFCQANQFIQTGVFISHAWPMESIPEEKWTIKFVEYLGRDLVTAGAHVELDRLTSGCGHPLYGFMKDKIQQTGNTIVICDRTMQAKFATNIRGVCNEYAEYIQKMRQDKEHVLIPITLTVTDEEETMPGAVRSFAPVSLVQNGYIGLLKKIIQKIYQIGVLNETFNNLWIELEKSVQPVYVCHEFNLPPLMTDFIARENMTNNLSACLKQPTENTATQFIICEGRPNSGKTQFFANYITKFKLNYRFCGWLNASDPNQEEAHIKRLAISLGFEPTSSLEQCKENIRHWLTKNAPWLLVIDDAAALDDIKSILPEKGGHVIFIPKFSSNIQWPKAQVINFIDMSSHEIEQFFSSLKLSLQPNELEKLTQIIQQFKIRSLSVLSQLRDFVRLNGIDCIDLPNKPTEKNESALIKNLLKIILDMLNQNLPGTTELLYYCLLANGKSLPQPLVFELYQNQLTKSLLENQIQELKKWDLVNLEKNTISIPAHLQTTLLALLTDQINEPTLLGKLLMAMTHFFKTPIRTDLKKIDQAYLLLPLALNFSENYHGLLANSPLLILRRQYTDFLATLAKFLNSHAFDAKTAKILLEKQLAIELNFPEKDSNKLQTIYCLLCKASRDLRNSKDTYFSYLDNALTLTSRNIEDTLSDTFFIKQITLLIEHDILDSDCIERILQHSKSNKTYSDAIQTLETWANTASLSEPSFAAVCCFLGGHYYQLQDQHNAIRWLSKIETLDNHHLIWLYNSSGRYNDAIEVLQRKMPYDTAIYGEKHTLIAINLISFGWVYKDMAKIFLQFTQKMAVQYCLAMAIDYFSKARVLLNAGQGNFIWLALNLESIAEVHYLQKDYKTAQNFIDQALSALQAQPTLARNTQEHINRLKLFKIELTVVERESIKKKIKNPAKFFLPSVRPKTNAGQTTTIENSFI